MIYDVLSNAEKYAGLNVDVDKLLQAAKAYTPENYPSGVIQLEGDDIFMNMNSYTTVVADGALMEAHRQYIDVMVMVEGSETIYVKNTDRLTNVTREYDAEIEALLATLDADATPVRMEAGNFLILFPQDAHAPCCQAEGACNVKKIVGKVRIR